MTDRDDMDDLKALLQANPPPAPDPAARTRAAAAATAAFEAEGAAANQAANAATAAADHIEEEKTSTIRQGSPDVTRQRDRQQGLMTQIRRRLMNFSLPSTKQLMMGGASLAVLTIAVFAVQNQNFTIDPSGGDLTLSGDGNRSGTGGTKTEVETAAGGETVRDKSVIREAEPKRATDPALKTLESADAGNSPADLEADDRAALAPVVTEEAAEVEEKPAPAAADGTLATGRLNDDLVRKDGFLKSDDSAPAPEEAARRRERIVIAGDDRKESEIGAAEAKSESGTLGPRSGASIGAKDFDIKPNSVTLPQSKTRAAPLGEMVGAPAPVADEALAPDTRETGRDKFEAVEESPIKLVSEEPVSTFSVDVDTASYSFMRSALNRGVLPAKDSIRLEELINYFPYDYAPPETRETPFSANVAVMDTPWNEGTKLMRIGIKGYEITNAERPRSNLVFLMDTSGSMNSPDKLPLLIQSFEMLLSTLDENDTVSIVAYAGSAGVVLEPTKASEKDTIRQALQRMRAGGSTAGGEGIRRAYELAEANKIEDGVNRVILATDGDFNVGIRNTEELKGFIERKRDTGVFLSVLGFGRGNYNDALMQVLAQNGNGVAAYIDSVSEAQKVLVDEATSSLFPIAKDVKIQVDFNPNVVAEYRLIGYETRALKREDFNNDKVDAAEVGAGHSVTAIYEITPVGSGARLVEPSRYDTEARKDVDSDFSNEYAFVKIRYKDPDADKSKLITRPVTKSDEIDPDDDARFAAAVAAFGQMLKGGRYTGAYTFDDVIRLANGAKGLDPFNYRGEFVQLVRKAKTAQALQRQ